MRFVPLEIAFSCVSSHVKRDFFAKERRII